MLLLCLSQHTQVTAVACHTPTHSTPLLQSPASEQLLQSGKFYYKDGSNYQGQYKVLGLPPAAADAAAGASPAKKAGGAGVKKPKEDEVPAQPAEPPKPVRHGAGVFVGGRVVCAATAAGKEAGTAGSSKSVRVR